MSQHVKESIHWIAVGLLFCVASILSHYVIEHTRDDVFAAILIIGILITVEAILFMFYKSIEKILDM
jgi:hypothetical protein